MRSWVLLCVSTLNSVSSPLLNMWREEEGVEEEGGGETARQQQFVSFALFSSYKYTFLLMCFQYSSSGSSTVCMVNVIHTGCPSLAGVESNKRSLRPLNVAAQTQLLQPSTNSCSVIAHNSLQSFKSQNLSLSSVFQSTL